MRKKSMPAFGRLKTFNLSCTDTAFAEDSSSIFWQWRSDHYNQRVLRVDISQAIMQDQYTSKVRSLGEKSNINVIRAHGSGGSGWFESKRKRIFIAWNISGISLSERVRPGAPKTREKIEINLTLVRCKKTPNTIYCRRRINSVN